MFKVLIKNKEGRITHFSELLSSQQQVTQYENKNKLKFPPEYVLETVPATEEELKEYSLRKTVIDQHNGALVIAKVKAINEAKGLTLQGFQALLADPTLALIERLLWQGSIPTAMNYINGLSNTFFSE